MRYKSFFLLLSLCGIMACSNTSSPGRKERLSYELPPPSWEEIDARGKFTFYLPRDMERQNVNGIDSYIGVYESPSLRISFDYGWYSGLPGGREKQDYATKETHIGGQNALIVSYRLDRVNSENYTYFTAVHFPGLTNEKNGEQNKLTMSAYCKNGNDRSTAQAIFESIRFP